jgi:bifunctional DNA-binding transcriptional regulator/antitoxin component of YhaV-PrlF toxin-antitoxin module
MAKVTSKLQVTLPKTLATRFEIHPGDDITWEAAGDVIRVIPARHQTASDDRNSRLRWFDLATKRLRRHASHPVKEPSDRGWTREDLYGRGGSR